MLKQSIICLQCIIEAYIRNTTSNEYDNQCTFIAFVWTWNNIDHTSITIIHNRKCMSPMSYKHATSCMKEYDLQIEVKMRSTNTKGLTHLCNGSFTKYHFWFEKWYCIFWYPSVDIYQYTSNLNCVSFDILL